jgi:hypothetical protein
MSDIYISPFASYLWSAPSKLSKIAVERCEDKRTEYIISIADEPAENLVFVDECAINQMNTYRQFGWAQKGQRAQTLSRFVRGTRFVQSPLLFFFWQFQSRFSILPALTLDGIICSSIELGAFNGDTFLDFITELLQEMNPYPAVRSVLVMDNCSIHHIDGVVAACEERYVTDSSVL